MTLAQTIISKAIESDNFDLDLYELLEEAARKGCLHHFANIVELFKDGRVDLWNMDSIVKIIIENNDVAAIKVLGKYFFDWERYIPILINNKQEEMLDIVLNNTDEIEDNSILEMMAKRGDMVLVNFIDPSFRLGDDQKEVDKLISIADDNKHSILSSKLKELRDRVPYSVSDSECSSEL